MPIYLHGQDGTAYAMPLPPNQGRKRAWRRERKFSAMTLCLPGVCERGDAILSVFDRQLTLSDSVGNVLATSHTAVKGLRINEQWALFFAGDDIRLVSGICDSLKDKLLKRHGVTLAAATRAVKKTCNEALSGAIDAEVFGKFPFSYAEFLHNPSALVGDKAYRDGIYLRIASTELGCDLLLAGFGARPGLAHIVSMADGQREHGHDREGYGAVGSGSETAYDVLRQFGYNREFPAYKAAYALCAAKFAAEGSDVGPETTVSLFRRDGSISRLDAECIRGLVSKTGVGVFPSDLRRNMPPFRQIVPPNRKRSVTRPVPGRSTSDL